MKRLWKVVLSAFFISIIITICFGLRQARHSTLFVIKSIEFKTLKPKDLFGVDVGSISSSLHPLNQEDLASLANIPVGKANLFDLDLKAIEGRLLSHHWIKRVWIERRLPSTVIIAVGYRNPKAFIQTTRGGIEYVDEEGEIFKGSAIESMTDLPMLSGFDPKDSEKIKESLELISRWESSALSPFSSISTVQWDQERGYRILISYWKEAPSNSQFDSRIRTIIDIGQEIDAGFDGKLLQLSSVIRYLSENSIAVRQIWADVGKKIVVKRVRGT